jgi:hypothetical protein
MAEHPKSTVDTNIDVFFCDQRIAMANSNTTPPGLAMTMRP